ncbi:MAG: cytochrome c nitrite reductase small subunit [Bifidobacteriaceae bacterium]|jgi:cytochrome c nitrite reductase small subunit|nr:cytochrome c nitrite reductase small subunit [Bifidobacteriaceae bacterium]
MATSPGSKAHRVVRLLAALFVGTAIGSAAFTLAYAELPAYLGTDPLTCTNCHVMQREYDAWAAGAHANVATCSDCHVPHDNLVHKLVVKAEDGVLHGTKFTFNTYPTNIVIRDSSLAIANQACLECHAELTDSMYQAMGADETITCTKCHSGIGHDD